MASRITARRGRAGSPSQTPTSRGVPRTRPHQVQLKLSPLARSHEPAASANSLDLPRPRTPRNKLQLRAIICKESVCKLFATPAQPVDVLVVHRPEIGRVFENLLAADQISRSVWQPVIDLS